MKTNPILHIISAAALVSSTAFQSAKAETYTIFNDAGTFAWDAAPWSAGLPSGSNIGLMQGGGTVTVDGSTPAWTTDALLVGWGGNANLNITGGNLQVGDLAGMGLAVGESGTAVVTQTGGLVLTTALRFNRAGGTGTYNLNGGTLAAGYVNTSGVNQSTLNFNGGTLQATTSRADWFGSGPGITVFVQSGGATIDTQAFDVAFLNNLFDGGGGGLTKNGTGTLTLDNVANFYTGATVVNEGTLVFKSDTITSSISVSSNATVVYDSPVIRTVVGISGAGNAEFKGVQDGFYSLGTALTHSGTTTINMTPGSAPFYGTLFAQSANVLSANSVLNVLSGKLDLRADQTIAGLTGSGGYVTTDDGFASVLTINAATGQTYTYSGVVGATPDAFNDSSISITKTGAGTQVLSGSNTHTGNTTVSAGTLALSGGRALPDSGILLINSPGVVNLNGNEIVGQLFLGGTQQAAGSYSSSSHPSYFTGSGTLIVGTIFNDAGTFAWDVAPWSNGLPSGNKIGLLQGGGTVTVNGSTPDWTTDALLVGWSGNASLDISGGNLTVGDLGGLGLSVGESGTAVVTQTGGLVTAQALRFNRDGGTGTYNLNGGTLAAGYVNTSGLDPATLNFNGGTLQATAGGANWFGDGGITVFVNSGGATIDTQAFDAGFTNNLFDGGGGGGLTKNGTGTLTLDNVANNYTGATLVNAGRLVFKSDTITSSISVSSNATVVYDSSVIRYPVGISGAGNAEFKGVQDGFYSLGWSLTHSGTTTINMTPGSQPFYGTLFAPSANVLSANSVLNVLSGKVDLRADQTIAGLTGSGGYVTTDGGFSSVLTINTATGQTYTYSGVVGATPDPYNAASISITKTGSGTQALSGVNTYSGNTTVSGGVLALSGGSAIPDSGILLINSPGVVNLTGIETVSELFINGTQQAAGNYTNSSHPSYFSGSGTLIVLNGPAGYDSWNDSIGNQTPDQDFDGDGIDNGVEYFMGTDGAAFTANPQPVAGVITWPVAGVSGASAIVQVSINLSGWTDAATTYPGSVDTSNPAQIQFTVPTGEDKFFYRLSVTIP